MSANHLHQLAAWATWAKHHGPLLAGSTCGLVLASQLPRMFAGARQRHHDAHWASRRDLRKAFLLGTSGVVVGRIGGTVLRYHGKGHVFVVAATQTGKSRSLVKSTLLEEQPRTSILVHDPKGELYETTAAYRATVSKVVKLAPCTDTTDCYNPLDAIRLDTEDEFADLGLVASMLVNPEGHTFKSESEEHFVRLAQISLRGLLLYGMQTGQVVGLGDLYGLVTQGQLADAITDMAVATHPIVRESGSLLQSLDEKQYANICICSHDTGHMWEASSPHLLQNL